METWPTGLRILEDNFKILPISRVLRSNMGVGPAKSRRRTVLEITNVSFNMILTDSEYTTLETFRKENDSVPFFFTDPPTGDEKVARFLKPPSYARSEKQWSATVSLEYLP